MSENLHLDSKAHHRQSKFLLKCFVFLSWLVLTNASCSVNILEGFADPATDRALLHDAKTLINQGNYQGAIDKFALMTPEYLARREIIVLRASAHGGLCGVNFLDIVEDLANIGTTRAFLWLMQNFPNGTAGRQTSCITAESLIKSIDPDGANRTPDENLLMASISFAKMGTILSRYADSTPADGNVDGGFDPCAIGSLPSADAKEVTTGFNIAINSLQNIGASTIGGDLTTQISTACSPLPAPQQVMCNNPTDFSTADVDATEENIIRSLLKENSAVGLGTCVGDVSVCFCP